jgi:hypothetical protein
MNITKFANFQLNRGLCALALHSLQRRAIAYAETRRENALALARKTLSMNRRALSGQV